MESCVKENTLLTFLIMDATKVEEALGNVLKWGKCSLQLIDRGHVQSIKASLKECIQTLDDNETPIIEDEAFDRPPMVPFDPFNYC